MSGGSYDYIFYRIEELAERIENQAKDPRRAAFAKLIKLVGKAMHDIEWVDSCDYSEGGDHEAIDAVFAMLKADPEVIKKAAAFDALKEQLQEYLK